MSHKGMLWLCTPVVSRKEV